LQQEEYLEIETICGKKITLKGNPNKDIFKKSIYKLWEELYQKNYEKTN
jgi:hypothetical protein